MGIGRKGRSCAWPPSRGVTSKSPMHAGAASSLGVHARLARRARQRRRVYQSGKGRPTNRGEPGGRQAHRWPVCSVRDLPRPEPRQRPGPAYGLVFAGRSAVLRRRRFGPALLREAPRCSCLAVACGDRGVSDSTWAGGLLFGADGVAATVSGDRVQPGMPPRPPRLPQAPRQSRLRCRTSAASRRAPRTFRTSREAAVCRVWMSTPPAIGRLAHPVRSAPAARRSSGVAHPCPRGCISRRKSAILACRVTAHWHLGVGIHELWCRACAGFPPAVWSPSLSGWLPTTPPQGGSHPAAGCVIVQCVDDIDEMQRWLEGRESTRPRLVRRPLRPSPRSQARR